MIYAATLSQLLPLKWSAIPLDPALGLMGVRLANIAAAGELPWVRADIDPALASRVIVDVALLCIAWSLRRNPICLAGAILGILAFELIFRLVYSGSLRHEGILAFLLISLVWIACDEFRARPASLRRAMALGLMPLLFFRRLLCP